MKCIILSLSKENRKAIADVLTQSKLMEVIKSCRNTVQVSELQEHCAFNLLFIDADSALNELERWNTDIAPIPYKIFLSTKKELAKDAFDHGAGFILLPITPVNLMKALAKVRNPLAETAHKPSFPDRFIFVKSKNVVWKLAVKEIIYIQALSDYVTLHTPGKAYTIHSTMKGIMSKLSSKDFIRVHKSFIVRVDHISRINGNSVTIDKQNIPLSRSYKKQVMNKISFLN